MKILFIYDFAHRLGGAITLTSRLTNWLIDHGHTVDILILAPRESASHSCLDILHSKASLHFVPFRYRLLPWYPLTLRSRFRRNFCDLDIVIALSREALFVSSALYPSFMSRPVIIPYVIDNVAYTRTNKSRFAGIMREYFRTSIPDKFKMFMSAPVRDSHADSLGVNFNESKILLLPIVLAKERNHQVPKKRKVVSISRIDNNMKKYVFQLPLIVSNLRKSGYDVTCDIYGYGPENVVADLKNIIKETCPDGSINFHGELPYSRFHDVLSDCFAAVGMGTSAIESSMFGVPTITAVAFNDKPISYGYLHELPLGAVGDDLRNDSERDIESMIADLCTCTDEQYLDLCRRHVEYTQQFDEERICKELMVYFRDCLQDSYRNFNLPIFRTLEINCMRGASFLRRAFARTGRGAQRKLKSD